jgi:hypothetical protein
MRDENILMLLWALPIAMSAHVFEEFAFPGGFARWIAAWSSRKPRSNFYYFIVNAAGILIATVIASTARDTIGFRMFLCSVAFLGGNAASHVRAVLRTKKYCPGVVTGGLLVLPLLCVSEWYFVSTREADLPSAVVCLCSGLVLGYHVFGVHVPVTSRTRAVLLVCLPVTMVLLILLPPSPEVGATRRIDVYDGFEGSKLSGVWDTSRFEPGAVEIQTNIFRTGNSAAKIMVHSRDKFEAGISGDKDSERAELLEAKELYAMEDRPYEYSFSMFIPTNFPIVPTRLVIAQWKQTCPEGANCDNGQPVLAIRYISGSLRITQNIGKDKRATLYQEKNEFRGRWLDFKFMVRFTTNQNGQVKAWLNQKQLVDYKGVTAYPEDATTGYATHSRFYFKMGLYRDVMPDPMTIYIDEYRKRKLESGAF